MDIRGVEDILKLEVDCQGGGKDAPYLGLRLMKLLGQFHKFNLKISREINSLIRFVKTHRDKIQSSLNKKNVF